MESDLRETVDSQLRRTAAYAEVKQLLKSHVQATSLHGGISERAALEQLLARTGPPAASAAFAATSMTALPPPGPVAPRSSAAPGSLLLRVRLCGGRAFAGGLVDSGLGSVRWGLRASLLFRGQRASGTLVEVAPGEPAPPLHGDFLFTLCPAAQVG